MLTSPWLGFLLVAAAALSIAGTVMASINRQMSPLESTLFGGLTLLLSTVGSIVISAYFSRNQARKEYEQLARPALRRVAALHLSTERVKKYVGQRLDQASEQDRDWLSGIDAQMQLLLDQMSAAISDWRELLPDDFIEAREAAATVEELKAQVARLEQLRAAEEAARARSGQEAQRELAEIRTEMAKATSEIQSLQRKVASENRAGAGFLFQFAEQPHAERPWKAAINPPAPGPPWESIKVDEQPS